MMNYWEIISSQSRKKSLLKKKWVSMINKQLKMHLEVLNLAMRRLKEENLICWVKIKSISLNKIFNFWKKIEDFRIDLTDFSHNFSMKKTVLKSIYNNFSIWRLTQLLDMNKKYTDRFLSWKKNIIMNCKWQKIIWLISMKNNFVSWKKVLNRKISSWK